MRTILNTRQFDASELCSRKLWQLINNEDDSSPAEANELEQAVNELTARRHYLAELAQIGKLGSPNHNA